MAFLSQNLHAFPSVLPMYEPFPSSVNPYNGLGYGNPENLGAVGATTSTNVWNFGNSPTSTSGRIQNFAALTYPGLTNIDAVFATYGLASRPQSSGGKDRAASLVVPSGTTALYTSCLLSLQAVTNPAASIWGLTTNSSGTSVNGNGALVFLDTSSRLLISKNSATPATNVTYSLTTNTTYLLVLRYKYNPGGVDQVDLWVNPTSLGDNANVPPPTLTTTNNANFVSNYFGAVAYFQRIAPNHFYFDEVRAGTNWAQVTPTTPAPGTIFTMTGGGSGCLGVGDSFDVGVSGSDPDVTYLLYTNGVFTTQTADGTGSTVSFGPQSTTAIYTVLASNVVSANVGWMKSNATVTVLSPPAIVTQPKPVVVTTNGLAAFTVESSGTGLNYQWYRNGTGLVDGGQFSGSHTPNLVISPATTVDIATAVNGYYVVITNRCGAQATSTTNALALGAPADLIWSGDGGVNAWDAGTSLNWNGQTAVFNFGDKVTFDDTSGNTTVILTNNYLSPTSILVDGNQSYTFSGGTLVGNGSLVMNSFGTLTLGAPNASSGGITISNGIVAFNNALQLGTGTITLAGGALSAANLGGITVNNPINVVADSTITVRNTSTSGLVLEGSLSGTNGTLIINNATTGGPTVRLNANGFTLNNPLNLNIGSGALLFASYNTNGNQIFNGVISGGGALERRSSGSAGAGNTVLNGDNNYTGGTLLREGGIGLGTNSTSSSPPTIDSGPIGTGTLTIDTLAGGSPIRLFTVGGTRTVGNAISYLNSSVGSALVITGANDLTLSGTIDLGAATRTFQVDNTAKTTFAGDISNGGLTKTGNGILYLNGNNTYTDPTTVSNGTLAGTGVLSSPVTVQSGATLAPGASVGTLTINSDLTIMGNLSIEVDKSLSLSNDLVAVSGILTNAGTGTLNVVNLGPALVAGDTFTLFSQAPVNGNALTVSGGGVTWSNHLAIDGAISVLSTGSPSKPVITSTILSGGNLIFSGTNGTPGGGYTVLSSTNVATPLSNWTVVTTGNFNGSGGFSSTNPVSATPPQKFYLLRVP